MLEGDRLSSWHGFDQLQEQADLHAPLLRFRFDPVVVSAKNQNQH